MTLFNPIDVLDLVEQVLIVILIATKRVSTPSRILELLNDLVIKLNSVSLLSLVLHLHRTNQVVLQLILQMAVVTLLLLEDDLRPRFKLLLLLNLLQ